MEKKQLLHAIKSLPMLAEDKEKIVNIILDNSGGGSQDDIRYYKMEDLNTSGCKDGIMQFIISVIAYSPYGTMERNIMPAGQYFINNSDSDNSEFIPIGVVANFNTPVSTFLEQEVKIFNNIFELANALGQTELTDAINAVPTITKEEFYNLLTQ